MLSKCYLTVVFKLQVIVLLVQEAIYICNLDSKDEERKKEILVMAEAIDEEDADAGECQNYNLVKYFFIQRAKDSRALINYYHKVLLAIWKIEKARANSWGAYSFQVSRFDYLGSTDLWCIQIS